jgi:hypothetical protein
MVSPSSFKAWILKDKLRSCKNHESGHYLYMLSAFLGEKPFRSFGVTTSYKKVLKG